MDRLVKLAAGLTVQGPSRNLERSGLRVSGNRLLLMGSGNDVTGLRASTGPWVDLTGEIVMVHH
jgi:hypothetical protein